MAMRVLHMDKHDQVVYGGTQQYDISPYYTIKQVEYLIGLMSQPGQDILAIDKKITDLMVKLHNVSQVPCSHVFGFLKTLQEVDQKLNPVHVICEDRLK